MTTPTGRPRRTTRTPRCRRGARAATPPSVRYSAGGWGDGVLGEDRVDLARGLRQTLLHAESHELLHRLGAGEGADDRHPGAAVLDLRDRDAELVHRYVGVRRAILVGETVADEEGARGIHLLDVPVGVWLIAVRPGHVVLHAAAGPQLMLRDGGGVGRRAPPALELARIGPQLPDALGGGVELCVESQAQRLRVLADGGHGHRSLSLVYSLTSSVMRSMRPRHSSSYWSSRRRATRRPSRLVRTTFRRPMRCLVTKPARSRMCDVFLHCREAHRVVAGQLGDALLAVDRAAHDVAAGVVRQRAEHAVEVWRGDLHLIQPYGCIMPRSRPHDS